MKVKNTRGFGKVVNPRTGDEINVEEPFETNRETFEALNDRYPGFVVVDDEGETPESDADETTPIKDLPWEDLRQKAVEADTDEINGRSSKDEIVAWLEEHR